MEFPDGRNTYGKWGRLVSGYQADGIASLLPF